MAGRRFAAALTLCLSALLGIVLVSGCASVRTAARTPAATTRSTTAASAAAPVTTKASTATRATAAATRRAPVAKPPVDQCAGNTSAQLVLVSIARQHAWLCSGRHTAYQTAITTGASSIADDATPTGVFAIEGKYTDTTLTLNTGAQYQVKYWIPFSGSLYGFHDAPWQTIAYGSAKYRTDGSHGCVHMPLAALKVLYDWAQVGTPVLVGA